MAIDRHFLAVAQLMSERATCVRRSVGCILVNAKNHVIATGYNGVPSGWTHCTDEPCPGAKSESGKDLDLCLAVHAEANALLQCSNVDKIYTCYTTAFPCIHCVKLLLNTSCQRIVYNEEYPHGFELWNREAIQIEL